MLKRILLSIVLLLVIAYLVVAITAFNRKPAGQVCRDMELVIKIQFMPASSPRKKFRVCWKRKVFILLANLWIAFVAKHWNGNSPNIR